MHLSYLHIQPVQFIWYQTEFSDWASQLGQVDTLCYITINVVKTEPVLKYGRDESRLEMTVARCSIPLVSRASSSGLHREW